MGDDSPGKVHPATEWVNTVVISSSEGTTRDGSHNEMLVGHVKNISSSTYIEQELSIVDFPLRLLHFGLVHIRLLLIEMIPM